MSRRRPTPFPAWLVEPSVNRPLQSAGRRRRSPSHGSRKRDPRRGKRWLRRILRSHEVIRRVAAWTYQRTVRRNRAVLRSVFLFLSFGMAACAAPSLEQETQIDRERDRLAAPASPDVASSAQVTSLVGNWRIVAIDGRSLDEPIGLSMSGDAHQLWWEPKCAGMIRIYRIEAQSISFSAPLLPPSTSQDASPVCSIGLPPRLQDAMRALDDAVSVTRTSDNGVFISGPNHSLALFSQ